MTAADWLAVARTSAVCNIGQLDRATVRALDCAAKRGELVKTRGHFDTLSPLFGTGPLKTVWRPA